MKKLIELYSKFEAWLTVKIQDYLNNLPND